MPPLPPLPWGKIAIVIVEELVDKGFEIGREWLMNYGKQACAAKCAAAFNAGLLQGGLLVLVTVVVVAGIVYLVCKFRGQDGKGVQPAFA